MLAGDGQNLLFEYFAEALIQRLELSPQHLKLRAEAYGDFPSFLQRLLLGTGAPTAGLWRLEEHAPPFLSLARPRGMGMSA